MQVDTPQLGVRVRWRLPNALRPDRLVANLQVTGWCTRACEAEATGRWVARGEEASSPFLVEGTKSASG